MAADHTSTAQQPPGGGQDQHKNKRPRPDDTLGALPTADVMPEDVDEDLAALAAAAGLTLTLAITDHSPTAPQFAHYNSNMYGAPLPYPCVIC